MRLRKPSAEPRRCSRRPLIASVGVGPVEEREDVCAAVNQGAAEGPDFLETSWDPGAELRDQAGHDFLPLGLS